jgi:hypothetical protein
MTTNVPLIYQSDPLFPHTACAREARLHVLHIAGFIASRPFVRIMSNNTAKPGYTRVKCYTYPHNTAWHSIQVYTRHDAGKRAIKSWFCRSC